MSKAIQIEPRARDYVISEISAVSEVYTEEVMEKLRPHVTFDIEALREQALRRMANAVIRKKKDENGVRSFFNCTDNNGKSKYINVETTESVADTDKILNQILKKQKGLSKSRKKVMAKRKVLLGQMSLEEIAK